MLARLWHSVRDLPRLVQLLVVVAVIALAWSVASVAGGDGDGSKTVVDGSQPSTTAAAAAATTGTSPGSPTSSAGDQPTDASTPSETAVAADSPILPTGDAVQMEPSEACPSGTHVEILGLLVCSDP